VVDKDRVKFMSKGGMFSVNNIRFERRLNDLFHSKPETSLIYTKIDALKRVRSKPIDLNKKKAENQ